MAGSPSPKSAERVGVEEPLNESEGTTEEGSIVKNVEMKVEGQVLTIRVDLSKEFGPSSSGKTTIIASTEGNAAIEGTDAKIGLNVYRPRPR